MQAQSGLLVVSGASPLAGVDANRAYDFTAQPSVTILGTRHGFGSDHLLIDVYDASTPRQALQAEVSVHPSTFDVTITFLQAQSGTIVLCGAADTGTANSGIPFTSQTAVTIPGATHGRGTNRLGISVYDAATPAARVLAPVTVHPSTFDVTVTFLQSQSGLIVLNGSAPVQTLTADAGVGTLAGTGMIPRLSTSAAPASLSLTGTATTPDLVSLAAAGGLTLTGTSTLPALRLTATAGSLSLTGTASGIGPQLPATSGSLTLSGTPATGRIVLPATTGPLTLTGTDATPRPGEPQCGCG